MEPRVNPFASGVSTDVAGRPGNPFVAPNDLDSQPRGSGRLVYSSVDRSFMSPSKPPNPFSMPEDEDAGLLLKHDPVEIAVHSTQRGPDFDPFIPLRHQTRRASLLAGPLGFGINIEPRAGGAEPGAVVVSVVPGSATAKAAIVLAGDNLASVSGIETAAAPFSRIVELARNARSKSPMSLLPVLYDGFAHRDLRLKSPCLKVPAGEVLHLTLVQDPRIRVLSFDPGKSNGK